jgi:hypothetical protein
LIIRLLITDLEKNIVNLLFFRGFILVESGFLSLEILSVITKSRVLDVGGSTDKHSF